MSGRCFVPVEKVRDYLLDPDHADGGPKCRFFVSHGFTRADHERLARALAKHFEDNPPLDTIDTSFGRKYVIRGELQAPDGRRPMILSVWIVSPQDQVPRFVTAFPRSRESI